MSDHREIRWNLEGLSQGEQVQYTRGWSDGYAAGVNSGRRAVELEDAEAWARMRESIRAAASNPDYATLAERRGEHDRAERTRRLWAERGIA